MRKKNLMPLRPVLIVLLIFSTFISKAQNDDTHFIPLGIRDTTLSDTAIRKPVPSNNKNQIDVIDIVNMAVHKKMKRKTDSTELKSTKLRIAGPVPAGGYSLETGWAADISANGTFCTNTDANVSSVYTEFAYTQYNQIILPLQSSIWTKDNEYNIVTDWHYTYYPSYTYGLGGYTTLSDGYLIKYSAIRLNQSILKKIATNMYAGIGYNFDQYWNIKEVNPPLNKQTDFEKYGLSSKESASGVTLNYSYDTRKNSINPQGGNLATVAYRINPTILQNATSWQSLIFDLRKYIKFPSGSQNIIAFWNYDWLTVAGKPPYLMLPYTGGDAYSNFGRGYVPGRYRGANVVYLEGEYRYGILRNGLLGGVVFTNAQSFTEQSPKRFETIAPGWGAGIRVKFNKYSRTNGAVDYGFGIKGSRGIFVNLGEMF